MKILIFTLFYIITLSAEQQKYLMIVVKKENCIWCKKLENEVFKDNSSLSILQKHYYITTITKESGNLPDFINAQYYPTTFVYTLEGNELVDSLVGYRSREKFLKFFKDGY